MSGTRMKIVLVAAIGENSVIGSDGRLPWRLKSDLQHFKRITLGRPVVMGRKTYASMGRPLKDRTNIVMTRDAGFAAPDVTVATSFDAALDAAREDAARRGVDEIMVIGGGDVFARAMPVADRLEITHVHARPQGDVLFPPIDQALWRETARGHHAAGPDDEASFDTVTYVRR